MRIIAILPFLFLLGCDDKDSDTAALKSRVAELETQLTLLQTKLAALDAVDDAGSTLERAEALLTYVSVNERNDVVVEGANLYVQDGSGETTTPFDPSGKGNLIIGYDEVAEDGLCVGGSNDGEDCIRSTPSESDCSNGGGACQYTVVSEKTGAHNLIVGPGHTYTDEGGFVGGERNAVTADSGTVVGGALNTVSGRWASVCGGSSNVASNYNASVSGGSNNVASGNGATVSGGSNHTADQTSQHLP